MLLQVSTIHSFLFLNSMLPLFGYNTFCESIHQIMDTGTFQVEAIMNESAMNICIYVFVWTHVFISLTDISRSGTAESCEKFMFSF